MLSYVYGPPHKAFHLNANPGDEQDATTGLARAIAAGDAISGAAIGMGIVSALGFDFLKPTAASQLRSTLNELEGLKRKLNRQNSLIQRTLETMRRQCCELTI